MCQGSCIVLTSLFGQHQFYEHSVGIIFVTVHCSGLLLNFINLLSLCMTWHR